MSPDTADDEASWSVVDAATHGSSTHPGSSQRALWPLEPLVPTAGSCPRSRRPAARDPPRLADAAADALRAPAPDAPSLRWAT
ncbi:hypothetical protein [Clavibacter tessellarius]|uniref:hypothetical protein n=1 Tax=Clavibacter tessellarius TaxID=31965 RepID=UPI003254CF74